MMSAPFGKRARPPFQPGLRAEIHAREISNMDYISIVHSSHPVAT